MKKIIYIFVILGFISCTNDSRSLKSLTTSYINIEGHVLLCDSNSWIESSNIVVFFDNKIITRRYKDKEGIFTIYNCKYDSIIKILSFAKKGIGPFEFQGRAECYYDELSNHFYLFDIRGGNHVIAYLSEDLSIENILDQNKWKQVVIPIINNFYWKSFVPLSDTIWIVLGGDFYNTNLISSFNPIDSTFKKLDIHYPQDGINEKPIIKRIVYNEGEILKKPSSDNKFLYYCTNWGNYAEIITFSNGNPTDRKIISEIHPIYKTDIYGMNSESDMKTLMGMHSYVTDNYIYLLPNFRNKRDYLLSDKNDYPPDHSDTLYIFDWYGNFVRAFRLNKPIQNFVVYPDDSCILGSCEDPEEDIQIIKFSLI